MSQHLRASELRDWALSRGRSHLTTRQVAELLDVPQEQVRQRLAAPRGRNEWVSPARGLWVPIPPEYSTWGAPPGIELIDLLASELKFDYYVGWLSAAAIYGAAHHAPQVFQVAVSRAVRDRQVGRTRFSFHTRAGLAMRPVIDHPTVHGTAKVSTRESTALDVAHDLQLAGGIDNAATVILDLEDIAPLDRSVLIRLSESSPASAVRRLGYILDRLGGCSDLDGLARRVAQGPPTESRLTPTAGLTGPLDPRWRLRLNYDVEVDW